MYNVGDSVLLTWQGSEKIGKVLRITPSGRIIVDIGANSPAEFNRDGVGRGNTRWILQELTHNDVNRINRNMIQHLVATTVWTRVDLETLTAIAALLNITVHKLEL